MPENICHEGMFSCIKKNRISSLMNHESFVFKVQRRGKRVIHREIIEPLFWRIFRPFTRETQSAPIEASDSLDCGGLF
jgi:hypothetical protein